jgi:beta-glucosidase
VSFDLDKSSLEFYDATKIDWVAESGAFEVLVRSSSRDIRLKGTFGLTL